MPDNIKPTTCESPQREYGYNLARFVLLSKLKNQHMKQNKTIP